MGHGMEGLPSSYGFLVECMGQAAFHMLTAEGVQDMAAQLADVCGDAPPLEVAVPSASTYEAWQR